MAQGGSLEADWNHETHCDLYFDDFIWSENSSQRRGVLKRWEYEESTQRHGGDGFVGGQER